MPAQAPHDSGGAPVLAAARRRLVVLGLGGRYVAMFEARLPSAAAPAAPGEAWFRPALALAALAVGYYQFMRMRCVPLASLCMRLGMENMDQASCAALLLLPRPDRYHLAGAGGGDTGQVINIRSRACGAVLE